MLWQAATRNESSYTVLQVFTQNKHVQKKHISGSFTEPTNFWTTSLLANTKKTCLQPGRFGSSGPPQPGRCGCNQPVVPSLFVPHVIPVKTTRETFWRLFNFSWFLPQKLSVLPQNDIYHLLPAFASCHLHFQMGCGGHKTSRHQPWINRKQKNMLKLYVRDESETQIFLVPACASHFIGKQRQKFNRFVVQDRLLGGKGPNFCKTKERMGLWILFEKVAQTVQTVAKFLGSGYFSIFSFKKKELICFFITSQYPTLTYQSWEPLPTWGTTSTSMGAASRQRSGILRLYQQGPARYAFADRS